MGDYTRPTTPTLRREMDKIVKARPGWRIFRDRLFKALREGGDP